VKFPLRVSEEWVTGCPWELAGERCSHEHCSLVSPAPSHVLGSVTTAPDDKERDTKFAHKVDTFAVSGNRQVKRPESVASERVRSALQDDRRRPEAVTISSITVLKIVRYIS